MKSLKFLAKFLNYNEYVKNKDVKDFYNNWIKKCENNLKNEEI